jgi:hypothetical protein
MNELFSEIKSAAPAVLCPQCGETFEPRIGSGGKSQRFCSTKCRRQFHSASPTPPTPDIGNNDGATPIAEEKPRTAGAPKRKRPQFYDLVPYVNQNLISAELDDEGNLTLNQNNYPDAPGAIVINRDHIEGFIDRLTDFLGYGSAP